MVENPFKEIKTVCSFSSPFGIYHKDKKRTRKKSSTVLSGLIIREAGMVVLRLLEHKIKELSNNVSIHKNQDFQTEKKSSDYKNLSSKYPLI